MNVLDNKLNLSTKDLCEWIKKPSQKLDFYETPLSEIKSRFDTKDLKKSLVNRFEYLNTWFQNNYVYSILANNKPIFQYELCENGYYLLLVSETFAQKYANKNPPQLLFQDISFSLAICIINQWKEESNKLLAIINNGLQTDFIEGGNDVKKTSWFILEMTNKLFATSINYKDFNYPNDIGIYNEALDNWNTKDMDLLDKIISKLCDFHLKDASYGDISVKAGKNDPMFLQFDKTAWFVYAFEILTWLSIREMKGLKNPKTFTHELMNIELNKLPKNKMVFKKNKLYEEIIKEIKK